MVLQNLRLIRFSSIVTIILFAKLVGVAQDSAFKILSKPRPSYTDKARKHLTTGTVVLEVEFRSNGSIGQISVIEKLPDGLTENAVAAARKIKFEPEIQKGIAVTTTKKMEYSFDISVSADSPEIKTKLKIIKTPNFVFDSSERAQLGKKTYKLGIYFPRDGTAPYLTESNPSVSDRLLEKFRTAIKAMIFEPALLENGQKISVYMTFDYSQQ